METTLCLLKGKIEESKKALLFKLIDANHKSNEMF